MLHRDHVVVRTVAEVDGATDLGQVRTRIEEGRRGALEYRSARGEGVPLEPDAEQKQGTILVAEIARDPLATRGTSDLTVYEWNTR